MYMAVKKQWYEILAPKMFGAPAIAETLAADPKQLIGRTLYVSLPEISEDFAKFYVKLKVQIESVEGTKANTKLMGHDVMRERIYRMVQRYIRRVDCIQDVTTKDGVKLRIKTLLILIKRVGTSRKDAVRKMCKEFVAEVAKETDCEDLMFMIIKGELQQMVRRACSKAYPIGNIEIRKTEVLSGTIKQSTSGIKPAKRSPGRTLDKKNIKQDNEED